MTKEEIIERNYNSTFAAPKYKDSVNKELNKSYFLPAMDAYAKQECIEFLVWIYRNWREVRDNGNVKEIYNSYLQSK